ncbi:MAG: 5-formyltetrahydrofolate cyclo-ligase [Pseudomonadota bacterium]
MSDPGHTQSSLKAQLRKTFRQRRRQLTPEQRKTATQAIYQHLTHYCHALCETGAHTQLHIAAYLATDGEVDLEAWLRKQHHHIYLPRIHPQAGQMTFHQWQPEHVLSVNRFGIREPEPSASVADAQSLDLVLTPLVAFDNHGTRLGMGGGYYDRYFTANQPLIGVAFQVQQSPTLLPAADWDARLHAVVTERAVLEWPANAPG